MPRPRWNHLPPDRRAPILAAAEAEFAAHGYAAASYNRVIAAAGVSKGAMYYYFDDKEDLFVEVLRGALAPLAPLVELPADLPDAATFWATVDARGRAALAAVEARPGLAPLARALYEALGQGASAGPPGSPGHAGPLAALLAAVDAHVEALLALGQATGAVRADLPRPLLARVTTAALVAMDRWFVEGWDTIAPAEVPTLATRSLGLLRDLLEPRAAPTVLSLDHRSN